MTVSFLVLINIFPRDIDQFLFCTDQAVSGKKEHLKLNYFLKQNCECETNKILCRLR